MHQKSNFKGRETVQRHFTQKESEFGRLQREIGVLVETTRPVFEKDDGNGERKGSKHVDVVFVRGRGKLSITVEEAKWIRAQLDAAIDAGEQAETVLGEEHVAWKEQRQEARGPRGDGGPMRRTGKTARKKRAGKAGEAYHRTRKAEKSHRSRQEVRGGNAK